MPVYSVARTLVDLFRQRNKIGIDVAIEALREAGRGRRFQLKELNRMADKFRMTRVIKPYMNPRCSSSRFNALAQSQWGTGCRLTHCGFNRAGAGRLSLRRCIVYDFAKTASVKSS